jgi:hypothetical protein
LDWVHYGYQGVNDVNRMSNSLGQIKKDNIGTVSHYPPPIAPYVKSFSWTGGKPIASKVTNNGIRADKLNEGFNVRMPANTISTMATLYVSTVNAQGKLTVDIPGGQVQPVVILVDSKGATNGYRSFVFKVYFRAKSLKEVSLKWVKTQDYNAGKGTVVLHGAGYSTFKDLPADPSIYGVETSGYPDMAISGKPHYLKYAITKQEEGVRNVQLYRDGAFIASVDGFNTPLPPMTLTSPRKGQYDILVTDNLGTRSWSNHMPYYLWTELTHSGGTEIPDNSVVGVQIEHYYPQQWVGDVRLTVNVTHPYVGDLEVLLISPSSGRWTVLGRMGGSGDNIVDLQSSESFTGDINGALAPFTGKFKPIVNSPILSQPTGGLWYVVIRDMAGSDVGKTGKITLFMRDP